MTLLRAISRVVRPNSYHTPRDLGRGLFLFYTRDNSEDTLKTPEKSASTPLFEEFLNKVAKPGAAVKYQMCSLEVLVTN